MPGEGKERRVNICSSGSGLTYRLDCGHQDDEPE